MLFFCVVSASTRYESSHVTDWSPCDDLSLKERVACRTALQVSVSKRGSGIQISKVANERSWYQKTFEWPILKF